MQRPNKHLGLHHVALFVEDLDQCLWFYRDLLGLEIEWQPDADNIYLTSGNDNVALHRFVGDMPKVQRLDHIGFILKDMQSVDDWYAFLQHHDIRMKTAPKVHRDGAKSFYCLDPAGTLVQMIYHPPIAGKL